MLPNSWPGATLTVPSSPSIGSSPLPGHGGAGAFVGIETHHSSFHAPKLGTNPASLANRFVIIRKPMMTRVAPLTSETTTCGGAGTR